jgi:heptosyltransferase-2
MRIVVLHAGGLGDLVLVEALLSGLRERYEHARIELICRADVAPVVALYDVAPDAVHAIAFNPYRWEVPRTAVDESAAFLATLPRDPVDVFISAELSSTWLSEILAAILEPREVMFGDGSTRLRATARIVVRLLGLHLCPAVVRLEARDEHELDRYARLAGSERKRPRLRPLRREMRDDERPIVVFPMGVPGLKRWPFERLSDACRAIITNRPRPLVIVGSPHERAAIDVLAAEADGTFSVAQTSDDTFDATADLIANADGYIGNDAGLAHLGAAYDVPGVTIYGGGTWPAYAPWGTRSAGVVAPIPCFGCRWDCTFDHAYCIDAITVGDVVGAYTDVCGENAQEAFIVEREAYTPQERTLFAEASRRYREAQDDRAARFSGILRLRDLLERYAQRSRTRQSSAGGSPDVSHRLAAIAQRLRERTLS